jgi:hypothetical protein
MIAALLLPSSASANYWKHCGNQPRAGAGWYHVRAHNIGCGPARTVAHRFTYTGEDPPGFSCQEINAGIELERVACRSVDSDQIQKVRFQFGA